VIVSWLLQSSKTIATVLIVILLTGCDTSRVSSIKHVRKTAVSATVTPAVVVLPVASKTDQSKPASIKQPAEASDHSNDDQTILLGNNVATKDNGVHSSSDKNFDTGLVFDQAEELVIAGSNPFLIKYPNPKVPNPQDSKPVPTNDAQNHSQAKPIVVLPKPTAPLSAFSAVTLVGIMYTPSNALAIINVDDNTQFIKPGQQLSLNGQFVKVKNITPQSVSLVNVQRPNDRVTFTLDNLVGYQSSGKQMGGGISKDGSRSRLSSVEKKADSTESTVASMGQNAYNQASMATETLSKLTGTMKP
jgi:hypothetical protein